MPYECIDWDAKCSDGIQERSDAPLQFKWKEQSDIQVAGMLAFYIHTKGKHPFGPEIERLINMYNDKPVGLNDLTDPIIKDLLSQMLARDLDKRPHVEQALCHPYFLSCEEQFEFLATVGNEPEIRISDDRCALVGILDNRGVSKPRSELLQNNWKTSINLDVLRTFWSRHRGEASYDGSRYTHCLRLIRNVHAHWNDKPHPPIIAMGKEISIKEHFLRSFPHLPLVVYQIVRECPDWRERSDLSKYFPKINRRAVLDTD